MIALEALDDADDEVAAVALWLLGRAQNEIGEVEAACDSLDAARRRAEGLGDHVLAAEISVSEAACLAANGDPTAAAGRLDDAAPLLAGAAAARLLVQRGLLALHRGDLTEAHRQLCDAEPVLRAEADHAGLSRLLANRSAVRAQIHLLTEARDDVTECRALARREGLDMIAAGATHNLAFLHGRLGEFPESIAEYERARREYERLGLPRRGIAVLEYDLCTTLSSAGLRREAIEAGRRAVVASDEAGDQITLGDALLQLSIAELADGRSVAVETATRARSVLEQCDRGPLVALADFVELRSRLTLGSEPIEADRLRQSIDQLSAAGWTEEADDVRLVLADTLASSAHAAETEIDDLLGHVALARRAGAWHRRVTGWLAEALRRSHHGADGVERALLTGLRIAERNIVTFGASDLRSLVSYRLERLVDLGLREALAGDDPARVASWIDRGHARSLRHRHVARPTTGDLATLLDRWRDALRIEDEGGGDMLDVDELERAIRVASRSVVDQSRTGRPDDRTTVDPDVCVVDSATVDDEIVTAVHVAGTVSIHRRAGAEEVRRAARYADAALRRLARQREWTASTAAARASLIDAAETIDRLMLEPLELDLDRPVRIVADSSLHQVPWGALPSLAHATWSLTPRASGGSPRSDTHRNAHAVAIAGPELAHVDAEVTEIAEIWAPHGRAVTSSDATTRRALDELARNDVVHIAAHGSFRDDSPTFSSFHLTDGPLTVYDLETLSSTPHLVVLAGCDLGRMNIEGSGDVLGAATGLLHAGVTTVIAPLAIVDDDAAFELMLELHRRLAGGDAPDAALCAARRAVGDAAPPSTIACAASFCAITTG